MINCTGCSALLWEQINCHAEQTPVESNLSDSNVMSGKFFLVPEHINVLEMLIKCVLHAQKVRSFQTKECFNIALKIKRIS